MNIPQLLNLRYGSGPHDLRDHAPGAGNIYPVDPAAVERFKRITAEREREQQKRQKALAIRSQAQKKRRRQAAKGVKMAIDPTDFYSAEIIAAAKAEADKKPYERRYDNVFAPEVVAVWRRWLDDGKTMQWIATHNGLIATTIPTVSKYLGLYQSPNGAAGAVPEPVPTPAPTPPPEETAVSSKAAHKPAPDVDELIHNAVEETARRQSVISATPPVGLPDWLRRELQPARPQPSGLASLVELLKDENVEVEGEIKLNLSIRINKKPAAG